MRHFWFWLFGIILFNMQSELDMFNRSTILQVPLDPHICLSVCCCSAFFARVHNESHVTKRHDQIKSNPCIQCQYSGYLTLFFLLQKDTAGGVVLLRATTSVQMFFWLQPTTTEGAEQVRLAAVGARGRKTKLVKQSRSAETKLDINYQGVEQVLFVFPVITKLIKMQWRVKKKQRRKNNLPNKFPIQTQYSSLFCFTSRLI